MASTEIERVAKNGKRFVCTVASCRTRKGAVRWTVTVSGHEEATWYLTRAEAFARVDRIGSAVAS